MKHEIEIKKALAGYTKISYNGVEIARHHLSATNQGTREAFDIPEEISVLSWIEKEFAEQIENIDNQQN